MDKQLIKKILINSEPSHKRHGPGQYVIKTFPTICARMSSLTYVLAHGQLLIKAALRQSQEEANASGIVGHIGERRIEVVRALLTEQVELQHAFRVR